MNCMYRILHNPVTAVALTFSTNYFFCYWSLISINLIISFLLSLICTSPFYLLYLMLSITSINIPQFLFSHSHFLLNMSKKVCWRYHLLNTFYTSSTRGYSARDCPSWQYFSTSVHLDNKGVILGWRGYASTPSHLYPPIARPIWNGSGSNITSVCSNILDWVAFVPVPQLLYYLILYNKSSNYFQKIAMSNQTLTPTSLNSTFKHTSSSTHTFHFDYSSANPVLTNCYLLIAIFLLFTLQHHKSKYSVSMYFINLKKYLTCFGK